MPDLDWVGMAGPSFNYQMYRTAEHSLQLVLPIRFGVATDFSEIDYVGWEIGPNLQWQSRFQFPESLWKVIASAGVSYASNQFNNYYYTVDEQYATFERPAYLAEQGFAGYKLTLGINRRAGNFWMGTFVRYLNLDSASFVNSPLVKETNNFYAGFAIAWILQSNR